MQNIEMSGKKRGGQKTWQFPDVFKPTEREKRVLIAKVSGLKTCYARVE